MSKKLNVNKNLVLVLALLIILVVIFSPKITDITGRTSSDNTATVIVHPKQNDCSRLPSGLGGQLSISLTCDGRSRGSGALDWPYSYTFENVPVGACTLDILIQSGAWGEFDRPWTSYGYFILIENPGDVKYVYPCFENHAEDTDSQSQLPNGATCNDNNLIEIGSIRCHNEYKYIEYEVKSCGSNFYESWWKKESCLAGEVCSPEGTECKSQLNCPAGKTDTIYTGCHRRSTTYAPDNSYRNEDLYCPYPAGGIIKVCWICNQGYIYNKTRYECVLPCTDGDKICDGDIIQVCEFGRWIDIDCSALIGCVNTTNNPGLIYTGTCSDIELACEIQTAPDEICDDEVDNDCDGLIDLDDTEDCQICTDSDEDNYYLESTGCDNEIGFLGHDDCEDIDNTIWQFLLGYVDNDQDGYGTGSQINVCSGIFLPPGYSDIAGDNDDTDPTVYPGATEICDDGKDNDQDGCTDDVDSDCGGIETDCTDSTDNDCDDLIDCADPDCALDIVCTDCTNDPECSIGNEIGCEDDNTRWECQMSGDCYYKIPINCEPDEECIDDTCQKIECPPDHCEFFSEQEELICISYGYTTSDGEKIRLPNNEYCGDEGPVNLFSYGDACEYHYECESNICHGAEGEKECISYTRLRQSYCEFLNLEDEQLVLCIFCGNAQLDTAGDMSNIIIGLDITENEQCDSTAVPSFQPGIDCDTYTNLVCNSNCEIDATGCESIECTDTDANGDYPNGLNYYEQGTTTKGGDTHTDRCDVIEGTLEEPIEGVVEYYCGEGQVPSISNYICDCEYGACLTEI